VARVVCPVSSFNLTPNAGVVKRHPCDPLEFKAYKKQNLASGAEAHEESTSCCGAVETATYKGFNPLLQTI
jgi:hypothetical protein